jgi:hypothetical protein
MRMESGIKRVEHDLLRTIDNMRSELDRIEFLTAALSAFGRPVPEYEPSFRHLRNMPLHEFQIP